MTKRKLIRNLGLATGLLLAFAGSAQADHKGDVVKAKTPYPLADATQFVVQGRRDGVAASSERASGANCRVPQPSLSLAPRERAIEVREVSFNPRTCRTTFERGVPPRSAQPAASEKPQSAGASRAGGVQSLANGYRYSGYGKAWYTDARTGKMVTSVESGADWNTSGGCIGANNTYFRNTASTATGWREVSHRWSFINKDCDQVVSSVNAHFRDTYFTGCPGAIRAESFYNKVRFVGLPNGGIKGSRGSRNEPSCKDTLIAYFALYRR